MPKCKKTEQKVKISLQLEQNMYKLSINEITFREGMQIEIERICLILSMDTRRRVCN